MSLYKNKKSSVRHTYKKEKTAKKNSKLKKTNKKKKTSNAKKRRLHQKIGGTIDNIKNEVFNKINEISLDNVLCVDDESKELFMKKVHHGDVNVFEYILFRIAPCEKNMFLLYNHINKKLSIQELFFKDDYGGADYGTEYVREIYTAVLNKVKTEYNEFSNLAYLNCNQIEYKFEDKTIKKNINELCHFMKIKANNVHNSRYNLPPIDTSDTRPWVKQYQE